MIESFFTLGAFSTLRPVVTRPLNFHTSTCRLLTARADVGSLWFGVFSINARRFAVGELIEIVRIRAFLGSSYQIHPFVKVLETYAWDWRKADKGSRFADSAAALAVPK
jgi:hypothetical protein